MVNTADETDTGTREQVELTPPSLHYLLAHLHSRLKHALGGGSSFGFGGAKPLSSSLSRPVSSGCRVQDLASKELQSLTGPALLARLRPVLLSLRAHVQQLHELLPVYLPSTAPPASAAAFGGPETEAEQSRFVEPCLVLISQCAAVVTLISSRPD